MAIKVGINGFGRIGRVIARVCLQNCDLELSAINDPAIGVEYISYLIKFDSTHGTFKGEVRHADNTVYVNDNPIQIFHEKVPENIPWSSADVQYVVEASGMFTSQDKASGHLKNNAVKRVLVTSPSFDVPMIVLGVNENQLPLEQKIMSCTSSTLYCLAPIIKILEDSFGVAEGFITSIHAMTPSLKPLDGLCLRGKHWRDHRSIHQNIIPAATGACKALGKIIPEVKDKLTGLAFRIPIVNVSVLDLTIRLNTQATLAAILKSVERASKGKFRNIVRITKEQTVSSDFIGESHSCILDQDSTIQLNPNFVKIICWYENEYSYACRVADSIFFSESQFNMHSSKLTFVKPTFLLKQDVIQQTECYKKEMSVSCCDSTVSFKVSNNEFKDKETSNKFLSHTISHSVSKGNIGKFGELFIKDDESDSEHIDKQNISSFFNSCFSVSCQPAPTKEIPKPSPIHLTFNNDLMNKPDQFKIKDKFSICDKNKLKEPKIEICGDHVLTIRPQDKFKLNDLKNEAGICSCCGNETPLLQTQTKIKQKPKISRSILITKCTRKKRDHLLKQTATQLANNGKRYQLEKDIDNTDDTITSLVERLAKNYSINYLYSCGKKSHKLCSKLSTHTSMTETNSSVLASIDSADEIEIVTSKTTTTLNLNFKDKSKWVSHEDINQKLNDEELKKRNTIPIGNNLERKELSDDSIALIKDFRERSFSKLNKSLDKPEISTEIKSIVVSECPSMCNSFQTNKNEIKLDIYDKLDSASESDSSNSFEISKRKSQVINIRDLTNSFEDLERLDKICRIIEISDELSDQLFSSINNAEDKEKKKKWSFKELCDKIHLDEFCEKIFGIN